MAEKRTRVAVNRYPRKRFCWRSPNGFQTGPNKGNFGPFLTLKM